MTEVRTGFNSGDHGFGFRNRFRGGAVVSELARQDRLPELTGLHVPKAVSDLTDLAEGEDFWGSFGLCGGMSWTALDRFRQSEPLPDTTSIPGPGTELFRGLVARQADSMRGRKLMERCLVWQLLPDRAPWWMIWAKGVGRITVENEWPRLQAALDDGDPQSLVLIRVGGINNPSRHHQVVATGYDRTVTGATVHLYDPNHPGENPLIRVDVRNQSVGPKQSTGEPVRGFFVWSPD